MSILTKFIMHKNYLMESKENYVKWDDMRVKTMKLFVSKISGNVNIRKQFENLHH